MNFEPSDLHRLNAALGWLELGNPLEASAELDTVQPPLRDHPEVLLLRWNVSAMAKQWDVCVDLARALTQATPDQDQGWINLGNSLYFCGRTQAAYDGVKPVLDRFPKNPVLRYNLACYACQLGNLPEAKAWLEKAFSLDSNKTLKQMALKDVDLESLWSSLKEP